MLSDIFPWKCLALLLGKGLGAWVCPVSNRRVSKEMQHPKLQRESFFPLNLSDLLGTVGKFSLVVSMEFDVSLFSGRFLTS